MAQMNTERTEASDRIEAGERAARAIARLDGIEGIEEPVEGLRTIANDVRGFSPREAWDAVHALEDIVVKQGLITPAEIEAERRAAGQ